MRKWFILIFVIVAVVAVVLILRKPKTKPTPQPTTTPPTVTQPVAPKKADWYDVYFSQVYEGDKEIAAANPNSVDRKLVEKLSIAQKSIDAALHEIDSERITEALLDAHKRRVKVRIVTETDYMDEHSVEALQKAKVPIVNDSGRSGLMHNKFIIVDERYVWTGSLNTSDNGAYKNNNNVIWVDSPKLAENFSYEFTEMYNGKQFGVKSEKSIPHPTVTMPDGTKISTYFAPENDVITAMLEHLRQARQSIYFMAFSFTHDALGEAMKERFKAGVDVRGVFEKVGSETKYSEYPSMKQMGIPVMQDMNKWILHHKVMIIDGVTVITGSFNFSKNASKTNDENVLMIDGNPEIARLYTEEFQRVSGEKTPPPANTPVPPSGLTSKPSLLEKMAKPSLVSKASQLTKLNINTMTKAQLESLPGIGPKLAGKIIKGRPYRSIADLEKVDGLGMAKIKGFKDKIAFR